MYFHLRFDTIRRNFIFLSRKVESVDLASAAGKASYYIVFKVLKGETYVLDADTARRVIDLATVKTRFGTDVHE